MCNYNYKNFSLNKKNLHCKLSEAIDHLPIDSDGKCIFHSADIEWKIENDFTGYLRTYVNHCRKLKNEIDLREVQFVAARGKLQIDYIDILGDADMEDAQFHHTVLMISKNKKKIINGRLHFKGCIFHHDLIFKNCLFHHEVEIENISFENDFGIMRLQIENCFFDYYFEWKNQEDLTAHIIISECEFKEYVNISSLHRLEGSFEIENNIFLKQFTFSDSEINTGVIDFSYNTFRGDAEFSSISLRGDALFNHPKVESKLLFIGTPDNKIFYGKTEFELDSKDIQGQILFQVVNLNLIDSRHLEVLKKLEKTGSKDAKKVVIGAGCIKYRWQTTPKTLKMGTRQSYIIEDLTRTFTSFLSNSIKKTIGVEILDRTHHEITFFYFSDENLTDQEFETLFIKGQQEFFEIMSNTNKITQGNKSEEEQMNIIHTRLKQINVISSILMELQRGNWQISDSKGLLESLALDQQEILSYEGFDHTLRTMTNKELVETAKTANVPLTILQLSIGKHISHIQNMNGNIIEHP